MEVQKEKETQGVRNSVFVDLFFEDETAEHNALQLFNALHSTNYRLNEVVIDKFRLEKVLYMNFQNDASFGVGIKNEEDTDFNKENRNEDLLTRGKIIVFSEHQTTINKNMPLRDLMYAGRAYERIVPVKSRYRRELVRLPSPEFYVFYNGRQDYPLESTLKLSDAFLNGIPENSVELIVKVININLDKHHPILDKCPVLHDYMVFIDRILKYREGGILNSIEKAINECINENILADYLKRKGAEVINMLIADYDYDMDIAVQREEAAFNGELKGRREGEREGRREGKLEAKISDINNIMKNFGCDLTTACRTVDITVDEYLKATKKQGC